MKNLNRENMKAFWQQRKEVFIKEMNDDLDFYKGAAATAYEFVRG